MGNKGHGGSKVALVQSGLKAASPGNTQEYRRRCLHSHGDTPLHVWTKVGFHSAAHWHSALIATA